MELNRAEVRGFLKKKEEFLVGALVDQLDAENRMLKDQMRKHNLLDHSDMLHNSDEKVRLLQDVTEQQRQRLHQLESYRDSVERERAKERTELTNVIKEKDQQIGAHKTNIETLKAEVFQARENADLQKEILDEIHTLKEDPPAWAQAENAEELREERDKLLVENAKFRSGVSAYPELSPDEADLSIVRYLKMKLYHYENTVDKIEKERISWMGRAMVAEEQLAVL